MPPLPQGRDPCFPSEGRRGSGELPCSETEILLAGGRPKSSSCFHSSYMTCDVHKSQQYESFFSEEPHCLMSLGILSSRVLRLCRTRVEHGSRQGTGHLLPAHRHPGPIRRPTGPRSPGPQRQPPPQPPGLADQPAVGCMSGERPAVCGLPGEHFPGERGCRSRQLENVPWE